MVVGRGDAEIALPPTDQRRGGGEARPRWHHAQAAGLAGVAVAEVCRKLGISEATFYNWKKKYSGLGPVELRRLRQLEEENAQLKRIVADLTLDKQMLQDVLKKKL